MNSKTTKNSTNKKGEINMINSKPITENESMQVITKLDFLTKQEYSYIVGCPNVREGIKRLEGKILFLGYGDISEVIQEHIILLSNELFQNDIDENTLAYTEMATENDVKKAYKILSDSFTQPWLDFYERGSNMKLGSPNSTCEKFENYLYIAEMYFQDMIYINLSKLMHNIILEDLLCEFDIIEAINEKSMWEILELYENKKDALNIDFYNFPDGKYNYCDSDLFHRYFSVLYDEETKVGNEEI